MGGKGDVERYCRREIFALPEVANAVGGRREAQVARGNMKCLRCVLQIEDGDVVARARNGLGNPNGSGVAVDNSVALRGVLIDIENFRIGEKGESGGVVL